VHPTRLKEAEEAGEWERAGDEEWLPNQVRERVVPSACHPGFIGLTNIQNPRNVIDAFTIDGNARMGDGLEFLDDVFERGVIFPAEDVDSRGHDIPRRAFIQSEDALDQLLFFFSNYAFEAPKCGKFSDFALFTVLFIVPVPAITPSLIREKWVENRSKPALHSEKEWRPFQGHSDASPG
jgi:hypothetical protein